MSQPKCNELKTSNDTTIFTQFQPIISVKKKSVIGVEALSRGKDTTTNNVIPPYILFKEASKNIDTLIDLDRVCRESALINFKQLKKQHKDMLLFMNIESSILDSVRKSNHLINRVQEIGINPCDIVLEINETRVINSDALISFVERYRDMGFIIALDDIGEGFSNLNRIPLLNPDIIKIDRFILSNINNDHYKKEVFKSLVELASNTGSLVVAEGIETIQEAILATELGADMIQGYYFSKPVKEIPVNQINNDIYDFIEKYKISMNENSDSKKVLIEKLRCVSSRISDKIKETTSENVGAALRATINLEDDIECMYILDQHGTQVSETVFRAEYKRKNKNMLFMPASKGTDHSIKGYYYHLIHNNNKIYISNKYMSMATGNMCITLSEVFFNDSGEKNILCIDFLTGQ